MTAQLELEVYRRLVAYLAGTASLRDFRWWFDGCTWNEAVWESRLVGQIELALAELSSGHRTEDDFKASLSNALPTITLTLDPIVAASLPSVTNTPSNDIKTIVGFAATLKTPGSLFGKPLEEEYA